MIYSMEFAWTLESHPLLNINEGFMNNMRWWTMLEKVTFVVMLSPHQR